ncbi:lysozyme [Kitasatospora paranensis]|uniref:Lysozyme n=1 Tax=Kitasatospora paranensis TaxID=258053 RepID=A0ABW2FRX4_9ACTN
MPPTALRAARPLASHRGLRRCAVAAASAALLLGASAPALAAEPSPAHHFDRDHVGSTVAAHEGSGSGSAARTLAVTQTPGNDVSGWQGNVAWSTAAANGAKFSYVKATEGSTYTNPYFTQQYNGSYRAGLIRGAYHFALPDHSSGSAQATWFVNHGGGWSADGKTLPPALDIEYNPYGASCYGLSRSAMVSWIRSFSTTVHSRTGRYPVIYTTTSWWQQCTGNYSGFGTTNPLWIARYSSSVGTLPAGWSFQTFWQYADSGTLPGDQDRFNGAYDRLKALALG